MRITTMRVKRGTRPTAAVAVLALAEFQGRLYVAWEGRTTNKLFYSSEG
jgi:hypothetical protein